MTHAELVQRAQFWLKGQGYHVVLTEYKTTCQEQPDAFGLTKEATCLIECKASRSDFLADKNKRFRRSPAKGMGVYRYFLTPKGMITPEELPEKWGLLEIRGQRTFKIHEASPFDLADAMKAERPIVYSILRRLAIADEDLLSMAVDILKLEQKLSARADQLKRRERDLERQERRLDAKATQLAEKQSQLQDNPWYIDILPGLKAEDSL